MANTLWRRLSPTAPRMNPDEAADLRRRLREVEATTTENQAAISEHEQVCVERYKAIHDIFAAMGQRQTAIMAMIAAGIAGQMLGWKEGFVTLLKFVGVMP